MQGVGFRPFVYRLARQYHLAGSISNTTAGVAIDVQGEENALTNFQKDLLSKKPVGAKIAEIKTEMAVCDEVSSFEIKGSRSEADTSLALLPDTAMCPQCIAELCDPDNRRYHYPFLHCISCGPRFSLFLGMPFDRLNTTMADFSMCGECEHEYANPADRRFYSQTNCCPQCGPQLQLMDPAGRALADKNSAISAAVNLLQQGKIVAVKNTGGYQLLVDATSDAAVSRLRLVKHRAGKPFAMLMPTLARIKLIAHICPIAEQLLTSAAAPIVLVKKKGKVHGISPLVAAGSPYYGVMLPHNALQLLLQNALDLPLVATSGNLSGNPLCISEAEALAQLSQVADAFLVHNRRISHRLDDSIVHVIAERPVVLRRARGYIPYAIPLPDRLAVEASLSLFAAGSQQKSSFALKKKSMIYMSQHIGDLETAATCRAYEKEVAKWENLLAIAPAKGVSDKHPAYHTNHYLQRRQLPSSAIQHHEAHVWSGMIDSGLKPPFFSLAWDGTGFGDDGTIWGGEAFLVAGNGMRRLASLYPFRLPGGDKAVREPRRSALGALHAFRDGRFFDACRPRLGEMFTPAELPVLVQALTKDLHAPLCSSMGRLFDAVSALLGCCESSSFEGQAPMALEGVAYEAKGRAVGYRIPLLKDKELWLMDWRPMLRQMMHDKGMGAAIADIAMGFHEALAECIVAISRIAGQEHVLLTGGIMQNKMLVELAVDKLKKAGFRPHWHGAIPPNDGGLAVGQLVGALRME